MTVTGHYKQDWTIRHFTADAVDFTCGGWVVFTNATIATWFGPHSTDREADEIRHWPGELRVRARDVGEIHYRDTADSTAAQGKEAA